MNIRLQKEQEVIQEAVQILSEHMEASKLALVVSLLQPTFRTTICSTLQFREAGSKSSQKTEAKGVKLEKEKQVTFPNLCPFL